MSGESETIIARHEQGDRVLSGGTDAGQLAETMERHAPPEPKEPAGTAVPAAEGGEPAGAPAAASEPRPTRGQARFSELAKARDAAQARADAAEARAKELEAKIAAPPASTREPEPRPAATEPAAAAKPAEKFSFPSWAEYSSKNADADYDQWEIERLDAHAAWRDEQVEKKRAEAKQRDNARALEQSAQETFNAWAGRRDAFVAAHPDRAARVTAYLDTLSSNTPIGDAIMESDVGPELADFLEANPAEAQRIAGLSPVSQIRALGRIEQQLAAPAGATRVEWKAPAAPMTPVNGNSPTTPVRSSDLASKGHDFDASGYREKRAAERKRAGR